MFCMKERRKKYSRGHVHSEDDEVKERTQKWMKERYYQGKLRE